MKHCLLLVLLQTVSLLSAGQVTVQRLTVENQTNPVGIGTTAPRFGWQLVSARRNVRQTACEIEVRDGSTAVGQSGRVMSDTSVWVAYAGAPLVSDRVYSWRVRVWTNLTPQPSAWATGTFQTGLLHESDWSATWIGSGLAADTVNGIVPMFRKTFSTTRAVRRATVSVTARGLYEARINGQRVGTACLTPGWTSYNKHLQFQTYDVTKLLVRGRNAIGVLLGSGWFRTRLGWEKNQNIYGSQTALLWQLTIHYTDGTRETIGSDNTWKTAPSGIQFAEIYDGERQDTRRQPPGWAGPLLDDAAWTPAVALPAVPKNTLTASINEPIRAHETRQPQRVLTTPKGETVLDFGQNLVGWVRVRARGQAGQTIRLSHVEMLDKTGNLYFDNLRTAKAQATYTLSGNGPELLEPHFTFFGFRYVRVEGLTGPPDPADFTAVALYSDMAPTGSFSCSNPLVNQLQQNIQWGQRGNFLDVPTDCPQRDERLGWTGDAEVFSRTAAFNFDVANFFAKWLIDVAADQASNGAVPFVVPDVLANNNTIRSLIEEPTGAAGWSDASIIIPWTMYTAYGDRQVVERQYPSMKAYLNYMRSKAKNDLWNTGFQFADWLSYRVDDSKGMIGQKSAVTDNYLVAQCFFAYSADLMGRAARLLGKTDEAAEYDALLGRVRAAFQREFLTPSGRLISDTQTAYVLALQFDMLPPALRAQAVARLEANIKSYDYHLTTGFLGTPFLTPVLTRFGKTDVAYKLLLQDTYPSWLFPVKMGATTMWERWDSQKPDSTFQSPSMTSFNHYAYGAVGDWLYRTVAGIDTRDTGPGYKAIIVRPQPGGGLTEANATLQTIYGRLSAGWTLTSGRFQLTVEIPANTSATVYFPTDRADGILQDGQPAPGLVVPVESARPDTGERPAGISTTIGSGIYVFTLPMGGAQ
jgi:alpha-L-rhamnosidase